MRKSRHQGHDVSTIVGEDTPTQHASISFTKNRISIFYFLILDFGNQNCSRNFNFFFSYISFSFRLLIFFRSLIM